jgi:type IV secretory pathway VirB6-like protein
MRRSRLIFALVLLFAAPADAGAQTSGTPTAAQLQALGQADATAAGVPWPIFQAQIQAESGWNPNTPNSPTGAVGIAQFLPSTSQNAGYGIAAFNPSDPVASLNAAAQYDAALYAANGNSWTAALSKYYPNAATDPNYAATYAAATAADSGQTSQAANQQPGISVSSSDASNAVGSTDPSAANASASTSSTPGQMANLFTWFYNEITLVTQNNVQQLTAKIQAVIAPLLLSIVTIALIIWLLRVARDAATVQQAMWWFVGAGLVVLFETTNSTYYDQFVVQPIISAPTWIAQTIVPGSTSPAAVFSAVWSNSYALALKIDGETSGWWAYLANGLALDIALLVMFLGLLFMFIPFAIVTLLLDILLIVGPIAIVFALFEPFKGIFWGWVHHVIAFLMTLLGIDLMLSMFQNVLTDMMRAATASGNPAVDVPGFWGCAGSVFLLGAAGAYLSILMRGIVGHGVAVGMEKAGHHMSGGFVLGAGPTAAASATGAVGASVGALAGGSAGAAAGWRFLAPVGASLSKAL